MKRIVFLLLVTSISSNVFAQCAMCKATTESSGVGGGLNDGIIYLMFIPYLLLGAFVFFVLRKKILSFYKEFRRKDTDQDLTPESWY